MAPVTSGPGGSGGFYLSVGVSPTFSAFSSSPSRLCLLSLFVSVIPVIRYTFATLLTVPLL